MTVKELKTKYQDIELFQDCEGFNLLSLPQRLSIQAAIDRYGNKKVLYKEEHDDRKTTEILIEL